MQNPMTEPNVLFDRAPVRYLSLFSGIEAATVAWHPLGWTCVAVAEIEPFPCAVLAHHYPDTPNLGDVTKIDEAAVAALGPIDLIVFGSPCQDLSVAGKRAGLGGERSGLFHTAVNIIQWARQHCGLRYALWENVPGAFSSNQGRDFAVVVGKLAGVDDVPVPPKGWGTEGVLLGEEGLVEWATLDAQFFGVAQRRRRVFALADFGDWTRRAPVLLEPEGLRGDSAPRREAGKRPAPSLAACTRGGGGLGTDAELDGALIPDVCPTLRAGGNKTGGDRPPGTDVDTCESLVIAHALRGEGFPGTDGAAGHVVAQPFEVANTLTVRMHKGINSTVDEGQTPIVAHALRGEGFDASEDGTGRDTPLVPVAFAQNQRDEVRTVAVAGALAAEPGMKQQTYIAFTSKDPGADAGEVALTLRAMGHAESHANGGGQVAVAFQSSQSGMRIGETHATLDSNNGSRRHHGALVGMQVRRLTPRECERLQGFPDVHDVLRVTVCEDEKIARALCAERRLAQSSRAQSGPVAVHVLIDSERREVQLRSLGRLLWAASTAANENSSLLRMPSGDFARLVVGMKPMLANGMPIGGVASPTNTTVSIAPSSGSAHVLLCGHEIAALAADAERFASETQKFTTSLAGRDSLSCEQRLRTLSCCVAAAINGCIPDSMRGVSSYDLLIEVVTPYTLIPYRNKPAADGPRYKALGNSMAVPVMRWIGQSIVASTTRRRGGEAVPAQSSST